jgi:hypothetical protein
MALRAHIPALAALLALAACLPPAQELPRTDVAIHFERSDAAGVTALAFQDDGLIRIQDADGERWRRIPLGELEALGKDIRDAGFFEPGFARLPDQCPDCPAAFLPEATTYHIQARVGMLERNATYATALGVLLPNGSVALEFDVEALAALVGRIDRALASSEHYEKPLTG